MTTGTVTFFHVGRGFGFIQPEGGAKDTFVHISAVERAGLRNLCEGQRVSYTLEIGSKGEATAGKMSVAS